MVIKRLQSRKPNHVKLYLISSEPGEASNPDCRRVLLNKDLKSFFFHFGYFLNLGTAPGAPRAPADAPNPALGPATGAREKFLIDK
jgi:hypothetical protein